MEIKMLQETCEIIITGLPTAAQSKERAEQRREEIRHQKAIQEIVETEKKMIFLMEKLIPRLIDEINYEVNRGSTTLTINWQLQEKDNAFGTLFQDWKEFYIEPIETLLSAMGYTMYIHEYSKGWQTRSGKQAYIIIYWH